MEHKETYQRSFRILTTVFFSTVAVVALGGASCGLTSDPCDVQCPLGAERYLCKGTSQGDVPDCKPSQEIADLWCYNLGGSKADPLNCEPQGLETGDTTHGNSIWDPGANVTYNSSTSVYEIENDFVEDLKEDGFAALVLDSARLEQQTTGYYKLVNVVTGDLADELGLQSNDIIKSVDGYDLDTATEQADAYTALKDETEFLLTIDRGGTTVRLSYEIVN